MSEIERLKEEILKDYPRLTKDDSFTFACNSGVACFNDCCGDVNIFLTPYDILRLKNRLGISSQEFLDSYTLLPFDENLKYPVVLLKMEEDEKKRCPFVSDEGCRVYEDRPWSCRMYPLGLASPKDGSETLDREFYFLLKEAVCRGHDEGHRWKVSEWLADQGIEEYDGPGEEFKELTLHEFFTEGKNLSPEKIEMFFLACYNLDRFRDFLFGSSFFEKFEVDEDTKASIRRDDLALLGFGYRWLRLSLFGEDTLTIKREVRTAKERELADRLNEEKS
jgi:Fe-S-cluster containining protein